MGGVPCIRGMRLPVATVVGMLADGMSEDEIFAAFPDLETDDVREAEGRDDGPTGGRDAD